MTLGSPEHLEYCAWSAECCRLANCDETLPPSERLGAQRGEIDWLIALEMEHDLAVLREAVGVK